MPLAICQVLRQTKVTCNQAYMNLFTFLFILFKLQLHQESNLERKIRNHVLYPFNYRASI